jgi:hypothetical protein
MRRVCLTLTLLVGCGSSPPGGPLSNRPRDAGVIDAPAARDGAPDGRTADAASCGGNPCGVCPSGCTNTDHCENGTWQCTCACIDGGTRGSCQTDNECVPDEGCFCGAQCRARTDLPTGDPPGGCPLDCAYAVQPWNCACVQGRCAVGTLGLGEHCDVNRDRCAPGSKCCVMCSGVFPVDGGNACQPPETATCTTPFWGVDPPICPLPP